MKEITSSQKELKSIHQERIKQDSERLSEIVKIAVKGLDYDRVYSLKRVDPMCPNKTMTPKYEYLRDDKGIIFKGVKIGEIDGMDQKGKTELWLTPNDFVLTSKVTYNTKTTREILKTDVDIFEINESDNYIWDHEIIKNSILKNLEKKKINLKSRLEAQKRRIDEVNQI